MSAAWKVQVAYTFEWVTVGVFDDIYEAQDKVNELLGEGYAPERLQLEEDNRED